MSINEGIEGRQGAEKPSNSSWSNRSLLGLLMAVVAVFIAVSTLEFSEVQKSASSTVSVSSTNVRPGPSLHEYPFSTEHLPPGRTESPLYDKTLPWNASLPRRWWVDSKHPSLGTTSTAATAPSVAAQLLLTHFGWNHPDQRLGIKYPRTIRTRQLVEGVIQHPWFHPTAFEESIHAGRLIYPPSSVKRYYIFVDVETCFERNYPHYGDSTDRNHDLEFGREAVSPLSQRYKSMALHKTMNTLFFPAFHGATKYGVPGYQNSSYYMVNNTNSSFHAIIIDFDCRGHGLSLKSSVEAIIHKPHMLAIASISSTQEQLRGPFDQGLPPPANKPVQLTREQEEAIRTCRDDLEPFPNKRDRPYFFTFVGDLKRHPVREALAKLNNGWDILVMDRVMMDNNNSGMTYEKLLTQSLFSATPRGDNRFSYRFTEVLSSGSIPVVYSDDWVLPFRPELVDWSKCVVRIPESNVLNETMTRLGAIDAATRCRMRQRCYEIYNKYMATAEGTIAGLIDGIELVWSKFQ